jgi:MYND finger
MPPKQPRCPRCGDPLPPQATGRPATYCSHACRQAAWRDSERQLATDARDTACQHCGATLWPSLWPQPSPGRPAIYCSPACRQAAWRQRQRAKTRPFWDDA